MICEHPSSESCVTLNVRWDCSSSHIRVLSPLGLPFGSERDLRRILDVSGNIRLGEAFPTRWVSQRWSLAAHYDARRSRRTYLRIMAIMLIIVSRAARASGGSTRPPFRVVVTACATITGIALPWTHAIHSLRTRAGPPLVRGDGRWRKAVALERKEGRTSEPRSIRGLARRHPLPSAARRLRELPARDN